MLASALRIGLMFDKQEGVDIDNILFAMVYLTYY